MGDDGRGRSTIWAIMPGPVTGLVGLCGQLVENMLFAAMLRGDTDAKCYFLVLVNNPVILDGNGVLSGLIPLASIPRRLPKV